MEGLRVKGFKATDCRVLGLSGFHNSIYIIFTGGDTCVWGKNLLSMLSNLLEAGAAKLTTAAGSYGSRLVVQARVAEARGNFYWLARCLSQ